MPPARVTRRRKSSLAIGQLFSPCFLSKENITSLTSTHPPNAGLSPVKPGNYGIPTPSPRNVTFAPNVTPGTYVESDSASTDDSEPPSPADALFPPSESPAPAPSRRRVPPGKRRSQGYIPRPPNAFMLFRADFVRQKHVPGSIETNHGSLSKIIGGFSNHDSVNRVSDHDLGFQAIVGELFLSRRNAYGKVVQRRPKPTTRNVTPTIVSAPFTTSTRSKPLSRLPSARTNSQFQRSTSAGARKWRSSCSRARKATSSPQLSADSILIVCAKWLRALVPCYTCQHPCPHFPQRIHRSTAVAHLPCLRLSITPWSFHLFPSSPRHNHIRYHVRSLP